MLFADNNHYSTPDISNQTDADSMSNIVLEGWPHTSTSGNKIVRKYSFRSEYSSGSESVHQVPSSVQLSDTPTETDTQSQTMAANYNQPPYGSFSTFGKQPSLENGDQGQFQGQNQFGGQSQIPPPQGQTQTMSFGSVNPRDSGTSTDTSINAGRDHVISAQIHQPEVGANLTGSRGRLTLKERKARRERRIHSRDNLIDTGSMDRSRPSLSDTFGSQPLSVTTESNDTEINVFQITPNVPKSPGGGAQIDLHAGYGNQQDYYAYQAAQEPVSAMQTFKPDDISQGYQQGYGDQPQSSFGYSGQPQSSFGQAPVLNQQTFGQGPVDNQQTFGQGPYSDQQAYGHGPDINPQAQTNVQAPETYNPVLTNVENTQPAPMDIPQIDEKKVKKKKKTKSKENIMDMDTLPQPGQIVDTIPQVVEAAGDFLRNSDARKSSIDPSHVLILIRTFHPISCRTGLS